MLYAYAQKGNWDINLKFQAKFEIRGQIVRRCLVMWCYACLISYSIITLSICCMSSYLVTMKFYDNLGWLLPGLSCFVFQVGPMKVLCLARDGPFSFQAMLRHQLFCTQCRYASAPRVTRLVRFHICGLPSYTCNLPRSWGRRPAHSWCCCRWRALRNARKSRAPLKCE